MTPWDKIVGKLHLSYDAWQTATLVSWRGHILSAAHGLVAGSIRPGAKLHITFADGTKGQCRVLELQYVPEDFVDLAILQLEPGPNWDRPFAKLDLDDALHLRPGQRVELRGFLKNTPEILSTISCTFDGMTYGRPGSLAIQLTSSGESVQGLSGALLFPEGNLTAVGIQVSQVPSAKTRLVAMPLRRAKRASPHVHRIAQSSAALLDLETQLVVHAPLSGRPLHRRIALSAPPIIQPWQDLTRRDLQSQWPWLEPEIKAAATSVLGPRRLRDIRIQDHQIDAASATSPALAVRLSMTEDQLRHPPKEFRAVIDFPATGADRPTEASHFLGISFTDSSDHLAVDSDYDLVVRLAAPLATATYPTISDAEALRQPQVPPALQARKIHNILADVATDILVFNSLPLLAGTFSQNPSQFSRAKVLFAATYDLSPWGLTLPPDAPYLPLAALARPNLTAALDGGRLRVLWESFLHDFLPALTGTTDALADDNTVTSSGLREFVEGKLGLTNQLSDTRLLNRLKLSRLKAGELGLVAVLTRKPRLDRDHVAQRLGRGTYKHLKQLTVLRLDAIRHLRRFLPWISICMFRFGGWSQGSRQGHGRD